MIDSPAFLEAKPSINPPVIQVYCSEQIESSHWSVTATTHIYYIIFSIAHYTLHIVHYLLKLSNKYFEILFYSFAYFLHTAADLCINGYNLENCYISVWLFFGVANLVLHFGIRLIYSSILLKLKSAVQKSRIQETTQPLKVCE